MNVAVVGAGAAGLAAASELLNHGQEVVVFEQSQTVGGLWNYTERVEDDPLGQHPSERITSSLYASLRVNLPRDLMAFEGHPFTAEDAPENERYPHHRAVQSYLRRFAAATGVQRRIRFGHRVERAAPEADGGWSVDGEPFDAVAVCNGHFADPLVPDVPGMKSFTGTLLHSHNYRRPDAFRRQRVVLFGTSVSGMDLSREIATVADAVYLCGRLFKDAEPLGSQTEAVKRCPPVAAFEGDTVVLENGERIKRVDAFVFCTGYHYRFPFLDDAIARVRHNAVQGLYRQMVPIPHTTLAFIGLPFRVVPFPVVQRQSRWFARLVAGAFQLPNITERRRELAAETAERRSRGAPDRHTHRLQDRQFDYLNALAKQCGDATVPDWFENLWRGHHENTVRYGTDYRERTLPIRAPALAESQA